MKCFFFRFGSQFFITLGEDLDSLDSEHLVFGQVVEGLEVINKLNQTLVDEKYRPYQDVRISHTVVLDDQYPDPRELLFPAESPKPTQAVFESDYIAADETIDDTEGKSLTEIQEEIQEKEAKARATILEMVGDLPDSDMAPPENVLFVCKLNPVTTSEDLEIIFSRFGKINSCEVIRDRVTDNSLQYAFIEFADTKSCEDAYFKMDNVLIDDRRIHVDFSQSVSKIKWFGKGRGVEYFDDGGRKMDKRKGQERFEHNREHSNSINDSRRRNQELLQAHQSQGKRTYSTTPHDFHERDQRHSHHRSGDRTGPRRNYHTESYNHRKENNDRKTERNERSETSKRVFGDLEEEISMKDDTSREKMLKHLKKSLKKKKKSKKYSSDSDISEERKKRKKRKKSSSESDSSAGKTKKKKKKVNYNSESNSEQKRKHKKKKKKNKKQDSSSEN